MKFELVLTYWKDGMFKSRDRIEADDTDSLKEQFELTIENLEIKISQEDSNKYAIGEDDDIPF